MSVVRSPLIQVLEGTVGIVGKVPGSVDGQVGTGGKRERRADIGAAAVDLSHRQRVAIDIDVVGDDPSRGRNVQRCVFVGHVTGPLRTDGTGTSIDQRAVIPAYRRVSRQAASAFAE